MIRALIVDDEAPARERMRHLLAGSAVEVVGEAADGETALLESARLAPDVLFLDIQMPGISGLDVAARLQPPRPRLIFCTAFDQFALEAFEHHAVDYLLKPVGRDRLRRTIDRIAAEVAAQHGRVRERAEAATAQAKLMPGVSELAGIDCAGACLPADGVGGDYFDVLPMPSGQVGFALGDVSGKGLYAGILAAAVQGRMQSLASRGATDPASMLDDLNRLTLSGLEGHRFVTLVFALYDAATGRLAFASAGHPPALLLRGDGTTEYLDATGPVIGWPDASYGVRHVAAGAGDILALYSDGLTEAAAPDGADLGTEGLAGLLRRHASRPAAGIVRAVLDDFDAFTGGAAPLDDRTLLVARFSETGPS